MAISADALQVYRGLELLTGSPTAAERARLEHRMVGIVPLDEEFSVGRYMERAHAEMDAALDAGRVPIVVGGTGSICAPPWPTWTWRPPPQPALRARLEAKPPAGAACRAGRA